MNSVDLDIKINRICVFLILLVLFLPAVFSQGYIESRIDSLFLADEEISFNVRVHNPTGEILEGRLFVEVVGTESNNLLFKDKLYLYPGDLYLKSLDDRLDKGDYKIRIELKDRFFETVLDQKILEFKVVNSCSAENICSYEGAYEKCKCETGSDNFNAFIVALFAAVSIGIVLVIYFERRRRRALDG